MTIFAAPSSPWPAATINAARPRLLATSTRVSRLAARWATPSTPIGSTGKTWASLQTAWAAGTGNAALAIPWAMKYLATGNATFATNAYNACFNETYITGTGTAAGSLAPNMRVNQSGIVLDWCYPALSSGQKNTLIANCQSFTNSARSALQVNGSFDLVGPGNNCAIQNYVFNALAAEGEAGFGSELSNIRRVVQNMLELLDESWADGAWRAYEYVLVYNWLTLDAYFTATSDGEATFLSRSQHMQNHGTMATRQLAWDSKSYTASGIYGGYRAPSGQTDPGNADDLDDPWQMSIVSDINRDPVSKWLVDQLLVNISTPYQGYTCTPPWSHQNSLVINPTYLAFLYYDDTLTGQDPASANVATCAATMPSGTFNFRGSWSISTALVGNYIGGPFRPNDHDMINLGCLTLRTGSNWFLTDDSAYGGAPSTYGPNGPNGTAASNENFGYTMRSSGPSYTPNATLSTREDRDGSGYNQSTSQPPGQGGTYPLSTTLTDGFRKTYDTGSITAFTDDGTQAICTSDLSKGFPQMTQALCKVVFKRGASADLGTTAVWDQFTAPSTVGHIRRNFHMRSQLTSLDGAITVQSGSLSAGILTATGTTVYFETGGYRCTIQCVSQLTTIDIIGGSGFEGWYDGYPASEGGSPISNGVNLPYSGNTQQPISQQRVANSNNWIINQWRTSFLTTRASNTNNEMMYVITVTAAGVAAPVLNLTQAKALFSPTPPPPPTPQPPVGNAFDNSLGRVLYILRSANMNTIADQQLAPVSNPTLSAISAIYVTNASTSLTTAVGGFYSGAGKTGLHLVANTQVYSSLTSASKLLPATLGSDATTNVITTPPYFALTTPQGGAATADIYLLGSDLNAVDATIVTPPVNPNGAQFITSSITSVSSLDTGRLGYIVAWGGNEFGYAFTYALSGAPAGLTIDSDMGILSLSAPLASRNYTFNIIVTNRENTSVSNTLPYTLTVLQGVTSSRSGSQVLHNTYDPASGAYGTPPSPGGDWTTILLAIQTAILADQAANIASDGVETQLRARIPLVRGTTYNYTNNKWLAGVQYYDVVATGAGANPILCNNSASATFYDAGPLNVGDSGSMSRGGSRKNNSALFNTVAAGSTSVTLTTPGQTVRLLPGRWHAAIGGEIQVGGEPPNVMFIDYFRVLTVNSSTGLVTFDRPLKYSYSSTWYEVAADDISFGRGWIFPVDTDSNGRMTLRGRFYNVNLQPNPHAGGGDPKNICYLQSHIQNDFDNCIIQNYQVTLGKHFGVFNGSAIQAGSEPDKQSETLFFDASTTGQIGGATGFSYFLDRSTTFTNDGVNPNTIQISPRQRRSINSTFNALSSTTPPYTFSYNGPNWYLDFQNTTFTGGPSNSWTFTGNSFSPLTIGSDGVWSGNQLQIASSNAHFQDWLINSYVGGIVAVTANALGPITANWGYINNVTSDGAGTALWLDITWVNGSKPLSGTIDIVASRMRRLNMTTPHFTGGVGYANAKMAKQTVTGQTSWDFPVGLPPPYND